MMINFPMDKKQVGAWCFYEWSTSCYFSIVTTFIFSAYFAAKIAPNEIIGTYWWGNAIALSALLIAFSSPIFGAIADYGGHLKRWLFVFTLIGIFAAAALWFAYPGTGYAMLTLLFVIIGNSALEIGSTFYNTMLPKLVPKRFLGRVSGWGWGMGYLGGLICLCIALFVFVEGNLFSLNKFDFANIRACGPLVASWLLIFSLPLFIFVKPVESRHFSLYCSVTSGLSALGRTLKQLPRNSNLLFFYFSRLCYIDALNTLFAFGGIYAATEFHMGIDDVLLFGIALNISAGIGSIILGWVDDWLGSKKTIVISLSGLIVTVSIILILHNIFWFWITCLFMGLFIGPVQASSRSLLIRIVGEEAITEKFGLFSFSGKATAFLGPWLVANLTLLLKSQRWGLTVIIVFFILGLLLVTRVQEIAA